MHVLKFQCFVNGTIINFLAISSYVLSALRDSNERWKNKGRIRGVETMVQNDFHISEDLISQSRVLAITSGANAASAAWAVILALKQRAYAGVCVCV